MSELARRIESGPTRSCHLHREVLANAGDRNHRKSRKHARVQVSDSEVEAEATARKGKGKEGPGPRIVSLSDPALGMIQREVARANKTLARTSRAVSGPVRNATDTNQSIG